ncbi:MAG: trypsin-like peptidase domain-containing protein [Acidimicrobiia bacterium]
MNDENTTPAGEPAPADPTPPSGTGASAWPERPVGAGPAADAPASAGAGSDVADPGRSRFAPVTGAAETPTGPEPAAYVPSTSDVSPAAAAEPVTEPTSPWSPPAATPPTDPTVPVPTPGGGGGRRGPGWRQFVVGAVVGALVGGGTAAGVALATRDDGKGTTRTVVVGAESRPVSNTSVIGKAKDVQSVLAKVDGAVVAVQTGAAVDQGLFSGRSNSQSGGAGTGFVISPDGVIVTNNHVVAGAGGRIEVEFSDGTKQAAKLLGRAPAYDLAVLKVDGKNLRTVKLGSSDDLQVGDQVVAVGNALALQGGLSVTEGIISGKGRIVPEEETGTTLYDMLQTDAAINPGNSGGPLVNAAGEVVGINTALAGGSQNVGFAISIDSAKSVIDMLKEGKSVKVAFLGVETSEVTPAIAKSLNLNTKTGAVIQRVTQGAAADKAGIKVHDVIVAIGGKPVRGPQDVGAEIRRYAPGDKADVTVERDGKDVTLSVDLGARPDSLG